ncbi:MAG: flagellin [Bdellovibrionota bacterium]
MSLRIGTNIASLTAQRFLTKNQRQVEDSYQALASGSRLTTPQNDAAGFAVSELLRAQVAGARQSESNVKTAAAMLQTAEGSLNEQNNILVRLRELAINSASDTIGDEEREFLDQEFQQLVQEFDRIAEVSRFGSKKLLSGSGEEFDFQVGPYKGSENVISFKLDSDTRASSVGIDGLSVDDQDAAQDAIESIDDAVMQVAGSRAKFGAVQSRFQFAGDNLAVTAQNLEEARSVIADVDVAEESAKLAGAQVLQEAGISVLASANMSPHKALKLIN